MIINEICKQEDYSRPFFKEITAELKEGASLHRKLWEYVMIVQALKERRLLLPGKKGLVFGVGTEQLPALFAKYGCEILATDLPDNSEKKALWSPDNQFSSDLSQLNRSQICPVLDFEKNVIFRSIEMNDIPDDLGEFDFTWSSCALEHLDSLENGLNFLLNQFKLLKPGGFAVHTTELNLSSNQATLRDGTTVLYRKRDLEELFIRLKKLGAIVAEVNFASGTKVYDNFVDIPPYKQNPHLKMKLAEFVTTSVMIIFQKPQNYNPKKFSRLQSVLFKKNELDKTLGEADDQALREQEFYYELNGNLPEVAQQTAETPALASHSSYPVYLGNNLALTRLFSGQKFFVDTRDISLAPHLLLDGFWEQEITNHFLNLLTEEDIFINVGANFGYYMILAALKIKTGRIIGFEPVPRLAEIINRNISVNGLDTFVKVENLGITAKKMKQKFFFNPMLWGSSTFMESLSHGTQQSEVMMLDCISLDEYCLEKNILHADMMIIDVEGLEEQVIAGMTKLIKDSPRLKIFLEFSHQAYADPASFFKTLQQAFKYIYYLQDRKVPLVLEKYEDLKPYQAIAQFDLILAQEELF
ncbi:MAG: FkbM family methyltransferase [bacterium]